MRKSLSDFAKHLKEIVPEIPANYTIDTIYKDIAGEDNIRSGIPAFRDFLCNFFDRCYGNKPVLGGKRFSAWQNLGCRNRPRYGNPF